MKISYNWLKQFLNLQITHIQVSEILTDIGLEVEGIEHFESVKGGLEGVVVGKVTSCVAHPNADKLRVTTVNVGKETDLQIVCGAPNVKTGQKVPVALEGCLLYPTYGESFKIKKSKIRGVESFGMICAEDELGIGSSHEGILILPDTYHVGKNLAEYLQIEKDIVFEIGLTPNRCDAMSHFGVARDLRAALMHRGNKMELITPSVSSFHPDERSSKIKVEVNNPKLASKYCGLVIRDVQVGDSPTWLKNRLLSIGLTPINNIVDITNYVLHEFGQPLHAFDAAKINGDKVVVKCCPENTPFKTLDEKERNLSAEDLMICNAEKPMCIAGVFGGLESGVTAATTSIFLESAYFDPISIRKTAKRHGLATDASFRFERGIDIDLTEFALKRAALLIKEIAGGIICSDVIEVSTNQISPNQVFLAFDKVYKLIGKEISREVIKNIVTSLDIKVNSVTESGIGLTLPLYRHDVKRDVDVIEEILRIYGYNEISIPQKFGFSIGKVGEEHNLKIKNEVTKALVACGFSEVMTNSLSKETEKNSENSGVKLLNPLSTDLGQLRFSMLESLLQVVEFNQNRKVEGLKIFEFGKVYYQKQNQYLEEELLGLVVFGDLKANIWTDTNTVIPSIFYNLKGQIESLFSLLHINDVRFEYFSDQEYSEALRMTYRGVGIGKIGMVSQKLLRNHGIKKNTAVAVIEWHQIIKQKKKESFKVEPIAKFQPVKRDLALLIDNEVSFQDLELFALNTEKKLLKKVSLFDTYYGNNIPDGKKSYALTFELNSETKSLTEKEINKVMDRLIEGYQKEFQAVLRG